jgi:aminopeptidase N
VNLKAQCAAGSTKVTLSQQRYYVDRAKFEEKGSELWQIPVCLKGSAGKSSEKCEVLTKKEETFTLPGCSTWVLGNAGATGYYHVGYQPEAAKALAADAETKLSAGERIALQGDIWASVRVGREPVGDYLAFAQGLQNDRNRAVLGDVIGRLGYIGRYLVSDSDRASFRAWLDAYEKPILNDLGSEPKPGESDEQKTLRAALFNSLGYDARDPDVLAQARKIADKFIDDPSSVEPQLAGGALNLAALNGDDALYTRLMTALKNTKSPEEYYNYLYTLPQFTDPKLLERTLEFAVSPDVRSQDALGLVGNVLQSPEGEKVAWDFIQSHWDSVQKSGGPFASARIVGSTGTFCDAGMRDQMKDFFTAHKVEAAERTYRQSLERINNCIDLKSQQEPKLASWLGQQGSSAGSR